MSLCAVCAGALGDHRVLDPLELELLIDVSLTWMLGTKPWSPTRAMGVPYLWATSTALLFVSFIFYVFNIL